MPEKQGKRRRRRSLKAGSAEASRASSECWQRCCSQVLPLPTVVLASCCCLSDKCGHCRKKQCAENLRGRLEDLSPPGLSINTPTPEWSVRWRVNATSPLCVASCGSCHEHLVTSCYCFSSYASESRFNSNRQSNASARTCTLPRRAKSTNTQTVSLGANSAKDSATPGKRKRSIMQWIGMQFCYQPNALSI